MSSYVETSSLGLHGGFRRSPTLNRQSAGPATTTGHRASSTGYDGSTHGAHDNAVVIIRPAHHPSPQEPHPAPGSIEEPLLAASQEAEEGLSLSLQRRLVFACEWCQWGA